MKRKFIACTIAVLLNINLISNMSSVFANDLDKVSNFNKENLILHYNFDKEENGYVEDASGNNKNGLLGVNASIGEEGIAGNYLKLDGSSYLKIPDRILNGMESLTISTWVKFKGNTHSMAQWQRIFDLGSDINNNFFLSKNRAIDIKVNGSVQGVAASATSLEDEKWIHVAVTLGNGEVKYYENGVKTKVNTAITNSLSAYWEGTENYIGKSKYAADPMLKADIDEFKIYNLVLNESEIKELMYDDLSDDTILDEVVESLLIPGSKEVYKDIDLPTELENEVTVKWDSNKPEVIDSIGKVTRQEGTKPTEVNLTAKITRGESTRTKEFKLYVLPIGVSSHTLNINADEKLFNVSDMLTGLFFEDINHGADGGLYSELIENRSFQYKKPLDQWSITTDKDCTAVLKSENPLNNNNKNYIQINTESNYKSVKLSNDGYKGITVKEGQGYDFSVWGRNVDSNNKVYAQIENSKGEVISDVLEINITNNEWNQYNGTLQVKESVSDAKYVVYTKEKGILDLDMISLFPKDNVNEYGLRMDLVNRMDELEPSFMRFPGGCVLEGYDKSQIYNWKNTIGNMEERKEIENLWGYSQSYGLGFYEYFLLCEDLDIAPVPILNAGMSCQGGVHNGTSKWMAGMGDELNVFIQDALDLIEYSNGDGTGEWSKKRVEAGHPEPFNLKYLGIGNEQWGEEYYKRFEEFQRVINEQYPEIELISGVGPIAEGGIYDEGWDWVNEKAPNTIVDEHYYMSPEWFLDNVDRYDDFDRNGSQVFIGEYASLSNTLKSAIAEAAFFTGIEKNSDIVKMTSYAPLFAKYDDYQWTPDMIWFDGETNYGSPNFYIQKLMSTNLGTQMVKDELIKTTSTQDDINGGVALGAWSTKVEYDNVVVTNNNTGEIILSDDFSGDMSSWEGINGDWNIKNGKLSLDKIAENCMVISNEKDMSNYSLELTAKKNGGNEGFLIGFGAEDSSNYYWLNIGGWNNTKTVVEKAVNGIKSTISTASSEFSSVKTGEEYRIKIVVEGNSFKCYINDILTNEYAAKNTEMFTSSSYDEETGDLIVKVVNTTSESKEVSININGADNISNIASVQYVTSNDLSDVNSFINPEKISIKEKNIENVSSNFIYEADKYSANVIRINLEDSEVVKETQEAPKDLIGVKPTSKEGNDGKITGVTSEMEYSNSELGEYTVCEGNEIVGLVAGEYYVRYSETDSKYASNAVKVIVPEYEDSEKPIVVSKVTNLKGIESNNNVKLTWDEPDDKNGLIEYIIYKDGKELTRVPLGSTEYLVNSLKSNTIYGFKIVTRYSNEKISKPVSINIRTEKNKSIMDYFK